MTKTQAPQARAETQPAVPLIWDSGLLRDVTNYIMALDARTTTTYFVEPYRSDFSGHRLWKAYCLPVGGEVTYQNIKAACNTTARRFKSVTLAKDACQRHATILDWPDAKVVIALTYRQYLLVDRAIEHSKQVEARAVLQDAVDHVLLADIEKQLPPHYKLWKQQSVRVEQEDEEVAHVLLSEPGFYGLFRCLSWHLALLGKEGEEKTPKRTSTELKKLRKLVFGKISDHEQRIVDGS